MTSSSDVTRTSDAQPGQRWGTATTVKTGVVVPFTGRRTGGGAAVATGGGAVVPSGDAFTVDCAECAHRLTDVCGDCVVSFIVGREADDAVVIDAAEARAVRLLEQAGLVPGVRHEARASGQ